MGPELQEPRLAGNNSNALSKRPFKLWDGRRTVRKGLVASCFDELVQRGRDKLGVGLVEPVRLVLECDGTQVEDGEYFRTLPPNSVLLLLRPGERWFPPGVDVLRAVAFAAIPKIVCETIHALELQDETPSWKIMDNKGRITVVLHWDQQRMVGGSGGGSAALSRSNSDTPSPCLSKRPSLVGQTSKDSNPPQQLLQFPQLRYPSPQITVINHDDIMSKPPSLIYQQQPHPRLSRQGSSIESATVHIHTPECAQHAHHPRAGSPPAGLSGAAGVGGGVECDFHCCALHEEGRKIAVHQNHHHHHHHQPQPQPKSTVTTSPIQDPYHHYHHPQPHYHPPPPATANSTTPSPQQRHVRFLDVDGGGRPPSTIDAGTSCSDLPTSPPVTVADSSESETENTVMEDEAVTAEKYLLLTDQLSVDQKRHLTIKDIGIILERLSSKILDVYRLERDQDNEDCYNWTINATIRGEVLRELGVIYNGNYYSISEHPGYKQENETGASDDIEEEEADEEEEEDRL